MATIKKYTKKDGSTAYQFNAYLGIDPLTGKKKRTTRRGFKTQKEAKLALARLQLEIDTKGFVKEHTTTFKEIYEIWYSQYINTVKPRTAQNVEIMFRVHILPVFGNTRVKRITKQLCQNAVNDWSKVYSPYYKLKAMTSKMLTYAVQNDYIQNNPMDYVVMPKKEIIVEDKKKTFLETNELKNLIKEAKMKLDTKGYTSIRLLAFTGMRKGELYALKWSDIDFKNKTVSITKTLGFIKKQFIISTPKTPSSIRTISLDDITISDLKVWKLKQKEDFFKYGIRTKSDDKQYLFTSNKNTFIWDAYVNKLLIDKLDRHFNPHILRHTHASLLFEAGATIKDVQQRLGHSNINTTMNIYTHVTKKSERRTIEKLNKIAKF